MSENVIGGTLMDAVVSGDVLITMAVLRTLARARINNPVNGMTPLMMAASQGDIDVATALLLAKADVRVVINKRSAMTCAQKDGNMQMVQLLRAATKPSNSAYEREWNICKWAVGSDCESAVDVVAQYYEELDSERTGNGDLKPGEGRGHKRNRCPSLVFAAKEGHSKAVRALLAARVDANSIVEGTTALLQASLRGHTEVMQLLLEGSAAVHAPTSNGHTALTLCAGRDAAASAITLLLAARADVHHCTTSGRTALSLAIAGGHAAAVHALAAAGARVHETGEDDAEAGITRTEMEDVIVPVSVDCRRTEARCRGAGGGGGAAAQSTPASPAKSSTSVTVSTAVAPSAPGNTSRSAAALCRAVALGDIHGARALLQAGVRIDVRDERGRTPLMLSARRGYAALAEVLLQARADVDARDEAEYTPLLAAAVKGHVSVVRVLTAAKADVDAIGAGGRTPLLMVVRKGIRAVADVLLNARADVNAVDRAGLAALEIAAAHEDVGTARLLLERSADANKKDKSGSTLLLQAIARGSTAMALLLTEARANLDMGDHTDATPLMKAVECSHVLLVQRLVAAKASLCACDGRGRTALMLAAASQHQDSNTQVALLEALLCVDTFARGPAPADSSSAAYSKTLTQEIHEESDHVYHDDSPGCYAVGGCFGALIDTSTSSDEDED